MRSARRVDVIGRERILSNGKISSLAETNLEVESPSPLSCRSFLILPYSAILNCSSPFPYSAAVYTARALIIEWDRCYVTLLYAVRLCPLLSLLRPPPCSFFYIYIESTRIYTVQQTRNPFRRFHGYQPIKLREAILIIPLQALVERWKMD